MSAFKPALPWGRATVIESVVATLAAAPLAEIIVVTGHGAEKIQELLAAAPARCVSNPAYETGGMLSSIQTGLAAVANYQEEGSAQTVEAVLLCLGDQPQMELATVESVLAEGARLDWQKAVIPSYQMRAGHPILLPVSLWPQIMNTTDSLRAVLRTRADLLAYLPIATATILADLDTPEDYAAATTLHGD